MKELRRQNRIALLGVVQEQHSQRCQLFAQWQQLDWPILHDPLNRLPLRAVPVSIAIDEHGIVRAINPDPETFVQQFLSKDFPAPNAVPTEQMLSPPDLAGLRDAARQAPSYTTWRELGDALLLWGNPHQLDEAIAAYQCADQQQADQPEVRFRLGVAYRMRYETQQDEATFPHTGSDSVTANEGTTPLDKDRADDFQSAVDAWSQALSLDPNQYIYRRRIQQYGPRMDKPYPFYDWVAQARAEILGRGERPVELAVEPRGAELAGPASAPPTPLSNVESPDPAGRIERDAEHLIRVTATVVPAQVRPGKAMRLHLEFRPTGAAHWNNEAEPLLVWIDLPSGWSATSNLLRGTLPRSAESIETRILETDLHPVADQSFSGTIQAFALYSACETQRGTCRYLRQDFPIHVRVLESAD